MFSSLPVMGVLQRETYVTNAFETAYQHRKQLVAYDVLMRNLMFAWKEVSLVLPNENTVKAKFDSYCDFRDDGGGDVRVELF